MSPFSHTQRTEKNIKYSGLSLSHSTVVPWCRVSQSWSSPSLSRLSIHNLPALTCFYPTMLRLKACSTIRDFPPLVPNSDPHSCKLNAFPFRVTAPAHAHLFMRVMSLNSGPQTCAMKLFVAKLSPQPFMCLYLFVRSFLLSIPLLFIIDHYPHHALHCNLELHNSHCQPLQFNTVWQ